ncbi:C-type lectin domain family 7 member A-like [Scylla paramamosain]|uniref:C-type lectin domain family 7 member A-like n=1 Tax=Scylla paramamosain TaxID=85552 RepID=UPI0030833DEB
MVRRVINLWRKQAAYIRGTPTHPAPLPQDNSTPTHAATHDMKWAATLVVAAATLGLASSKSDCPVGFINLSNDPSSPECLNFVLNTGTWQHMNYMCGIIHANISKITGDLHYRLYNYIRATPGLTDHCFWIGGSDHQEEGHWVWESDGSDISMGTPHWDACERDPNGSIWQNYLCICPPDYYFRDCANDAMMYGICQVEV